MRHCQTLALVLSLTACEKANELITQPSPPKQEAEPTDSSVGITQQELAPPTAPLPRAIESRRAPTRAVIRAQPPSDLVKNPAPILAPLPAPPPLAAVAAQPKSDIAPPTPPSIQTQQQPTLSLDRPVYEGFRATRAYPGWKLANKKPRVTPKVAQPADAGIANETEGTPGLTTEPTVTRQR